MKANINKPKKEKVKLGDRVANSLFCEIIDVLIKRYDESDEKQTMSFKAYCIRLRDLSNKQVGKDVTTDIDDTDEENQKNLRKEKLNNECSS